MAIVKREAIVNLAAIQSRLDAIAKVQPNLLGRAPQSDSAQHQPRNDMSSDVVQPLRESAGTFRMPSEVTLQSPLEATDDEASSSG